MAALDDQRLAAGIMWIAGDAIFLTAILAVVAGWMRAEARDEARADRRADAELVADPRSASGGSPSASPTSAGERTGQRTAGRAADAPLSPRAGSAPRGSSR